MEKNNDRCIVTADALITDGSRVLLIRRAKEPFLDKVVMPGGHMEVTDVSVIAATIREVREEVGLVLEERDITFFCILDSPTRDPRPGRKVAMVYLARVEPSVLDSAVAGSDAAEIMLRDLASLTESELGFDHFDALCQYHNQLLWQQSLEEDDESWPDPPPGK